MCLFWLVSFPVAFQTVRQKCCQSRLEVEVHDLWRVFCASWSTSTFWLAWWPRRFTHGIIIFSSFCIVTAPWRHCTVCMIFLFISMGPDPLSDSVLRLGLFWSAAMGVAIRYAISMGHSRRNWSDETRSYDWVRKWSGPYPDTSLTTSFWEYAALVSMVLSVCTFSLCLLAVSWKNVELKRFLGF